MKIVKKFLPYLILIIFIAIAYGISQSTPDVKKRGTRSSTILSVEVTKLTGEDYQVVIDSFGKIIPKTQGQLTAQVSGQIIKVSDNFNEGSFFTAGDVLVAIDPRDFQIRVETADAELSQAKVDLDEEIALSKQAIKDRKNLGHSDNASDFALRKPQMAAARAKVQSANAKLKQALLDVERTLIRAPYDGRINKKNADLGQMVNANTNIADIYATDVAQIRLPIKNSELALIELPHNKRQAVTTLKQDNVIVANNLGGDVEHWSASLLRTTGAIDANTQQLHVIAQITRPFNHPQLRSLNIGQYASAQISGKLIRDTIVIPNSAIYQGSYVYVLEDGKLQRRDIRIRYQNTQQSVIETGLQAGEQLVITPLGQVSSGTSVKIATNERPTPKAAERLGAPH